MTMKPTRDNPDWRELVEAGMARRAGRPGVSLAVRLPPDMANFVLTAAELRGGLSLTAYLRRAALAVAAYDLDLPWQAVMANEPRVRMMDVEGKPYSAVSGPGLGFGAWIIPEMREYRP